MKTPILKFFSILLLITGLMSGILANEIKVPSKMIHITIYKQNARISHKATVSIPAGTSTIVLEKLTSYIDQNSIQVSLSNPVRLVTVSFRTNFLENPEMPRLIKLLGDSLENLNYQLTWIKDQKNVLETEEHLIEENNKVYSTQNGVVTANLTSLADYYRKRILEIKFQWRKLDRDDKKLTEKISQLQSQYNQNTANKSMPAGEIVLEVYSPNTVNTEIEFTYLVATAGWSPLYEIRSDGIDKPVMITYKANIYQNTGFEWNNVPLTISTGNPSANNTVPVFTSRYLNFYVVNQTIGFNSNTVTKRYAEQAPAAIQKDDYDESVFQPTVVTEHQLNVEFDVPMKYNIPSDGRYHLVNMKDYSIAADYEYFSLPNQDKGAFLIAKLADWGKLNLLQGPANIFFENTYIGQTNINPFLAVDTLPISFGRDEKVVISREKITDFTSIKYIGSNKKITYAIEISLKNTKSTAIKIKVTDQLPVSKISEITVEPGDLAGAELDTDSGKLTWKLDLKPGESKKMKFTYTVKFPKSSTVTGLE